MPAKPFVSERQWEIMLEFMQANRNFATYTNQRESPGPKPDFMRLWDELAAKLNSAGSGGTKTAIKWREYWSCLKYQIRKKIRLMRQQSKKLVDGPPERVLTLTTKDKQMLSLMGIPVVSVRIPLNGNKTAPPTLLPVPPKVESDRDSMSPLMIPSSPCEELASPLPPPESPSPQAPAQLATTTKIAPSQQQPKPKPVFRRRIENAPLNKVLQMERRRFAVEERTMKAVERLVEDLATMRAEIKDATERILPESDTSICHSEERQSNETQNGSIPVVKSITRNILNINKDISQRKDHFIRTPDKVKTSPILDLEHDVTKDKDEFDFFGCSMAMQLKKLPELDALELMQKMLLMVTEIKKKRKEENVTKELNHSRYSQGKRPTRTSTPDLYSESMNDSFVQYTGHQGLDLSEQDTRQELLTGQHNFRITLEKQPDATEFVVLRDFGSKP